MCLKWKTRWATIPRRVMQYFVDGKFETFPVNFYVFGVEGYRLAPGTVAASKSVAYRRHKKILQSLKAAGQLQSLEGLIWYSWKDTGISVHARHTSPLATRDQAGHQMICSSDLPGKIRFFK